MGRNALRLVALLALAARCSGFVYQPAAGQIWGPSVFYWNGTAGGAYRSYGKSRQAPAEAGFYAISMYSPTGNKQYPSGFLSHSADGVQWRDVGAIAAAHAA